TQTPTRYIVVTSALLGAVALGHNITLLLLPLVLGPYVLLLFATAPGDRSTKYRRAGWLAAGSLMAAGLTAFFWLPLIAERSLLSHSAFNAPNLHDHVWSLTTFLETNLPYDYGRSAVPFRLGLVQVILAVAGLLLTRLRLPQWWYWVGLGALCLIGITPAILPLWNSIELLSIVQFPWRLLSFVSLSTALITAGLATLARRQRWQATLTGVVVGIVILGARPVIATYNMSMYVDLAMDPAVIARYEAGYGAWGAGWHREFLPQWAEAFDATPALIEPAGSAPGRVALRAISPEGVELQVQSAAPATLRLSQFYFPGWQATLDGVTPAPVYPSTQQGLVTVDLPAGEHTLRVAWAKSTVEVWAEWFSLAVALLLGATLALQRRWRLAALPVLAATILLALLLKSPFRVQAEPVQLVSIDVLPGLDMLGYQTAVADNGRSLLIAPVWYNLRQYEDLDISWRLVDDSGEIVSQISSAPYFGALPGTRWQPDTVIRDGYRLPLPVGRPAATYALEFRVDAQTATTDWQQVGHVAAPALSAPQPVEVVFTDPQSREQAALAGYALSVNGAPQTLTDGQPPRIRPGDRVAITLYWRAMSELSEDYHSFLHLVSHDRQTLVSLDKIPGQESALPRFWDRAYTEADTYELAIPADAPSGLYYPRVGLYDADDTDRFLVNTADAVVDAIDLAPLKVVATRNVAPQQRTEITYGDFGQLVGYAVAPAGGALQPGAAVTVTVYYRGLQPAAADYTQFFQLYSPTSGMAAQADQPPLQGGNPTRTWEQGESIVDQVVLTIDPAAAPGEYTLNTGMYDPVSGARAPLTAADGAPLADQQLPLATFTVGE
ncbi:MAG: hypothetical protein KAX65_05250, partial [Caldilineaceae bacterium]|nr:hypothetical protein [Caldilineaceae bacterium]